MTYKTLQALSLGTSLISAPTTLPFILSAPATIALLLSLNQTKHAPVSGTFHLLFPVQSYFSSKYSYYLLPHFL